jgi:hypothetical protein
MNTSGGPVEPWSRRRAAVVIASTRKRPILQLRQIQKPRPLRLWGSKFPVIHLNKTTRRTLINRHWSPRSNTNRVRSAVVLIHVLWHDGVGILHLHFWRAGALRTSFLCSHYAFHFGPTAPHETYPKNNVLPKNDRFADPVAEQRTEGLRSHRSTKIIALRLVTAMSL